MVYDPSGPSFTETEAPGKWTKIDVLPSSEEPVNAMCSFRFNPCDTRFSPCGRVGVNNCYTNDFEVAIIDVLNNKWFSSTLKEIKQNVFTYYLLDAKSLVVVEMITADSNIVRQHLIKINWLAHNAELIQTIDHVFLARTYNNIPYNWEMERDNDLLHPHVAVSLEGQEYTALLSNGSERRIIYLVPKNPLDLNAKPKEFCISTNPVELELKLLELTGIRKVRFKMSALSYNGLIHLVMIVKESPHWGNIILGAYTTINVSKLADIHQKPFNSLDEESHDKEQVNAMNVISYTSSALMIPTHYGRAYFSTVNNCSLIRVPDINALDYNNMFYSFKSEQHAFDNTYHVLGSPKISTVKGSALSALSIHPFGSIYQFHKLLDSNQFSVSMVGHHKMSLQSLVKSNLIFRQYSPINAIPGLHRIVFKGPIQMDEQKEQNKKNE